MSGTAWGTDKKNNFYLFKAVCTALFFIDDNFKQIEAMKYGGIVLPSEI